MTKTANDPKATASNVGVGRSGTGPQVLTENDIKPLNRLMYGLVIVLFIGFAAMFVSVGQMLYDGWTNKQSSYQDLRNDVKTQNDKINELTKEVTNLTKAIQDEQKATQKTH